MFDWNKFVMLGYLLLMDDGEEYVRSAISRQYYGLFGVIRRYMINVEHKNKLKSRDGNVHRKVYLALKNSNNPKQNEICKTFNKLRVIRNQADYDSEFNVYHFKKFLNDNEKKLEVAFGTIDYLKSHLIIEVF